MADQGRPTLYNEDKANYIGELIATSSMSMKKICDEVDISYSTHLHWLRTNPEYLSIYTRAKEDQADFLAEEMLEIADDNTGDEVVTVSEEGIEVRKRDPDNVQRSKLRVDTRKFIAAKLKPKKYGDKIDLTSDGKAMPIPRIIMPKLDDE